MTPAAIVVAVAATADPLAPLTLWVLLTALGTTAVVGIPLLTGLLSYRRASRAAQQQDIATQVGPIIAAMIKGHNEELYAHPAALQRYTTMETFNGAMRELRTEISSLRGVIDSNEQQRKEDVRLFREDFRDLKQNVARAVGERERET